MQRRDDGSITLNAQELTVPDLSDGQTGPVVISMAASRPPRPWSRRSGTCCARTGDHRGAGEAEQPRKLEMMKLGVDFRVNPNPALFGDLKVLLGPACLDV